MQIKVKKTHPDALLPAFGTIGAACFDIHALIDTEIKEGWATHEGSIFDTGLSFEIPDGYAMMIYSRSGHGFKDNMRLSNCVGIIDSDYRGEVKVKLIVDSGKPAIRVKHNDRIAQGMIVPVMQISFTEGELSETVRGTAGFGSTG